MLEAHGCIHGGKRNSISCLRQGLARIGLSGSGQKFDAQVIGFDRSKKPNFSIKALQIAEEKQAVAQYGSSDSGASLGDILGAALKEKAAAAEAKPKKKK